MHALGRLFDVGLGWAPVDLNTGDGATGKRISLAGASGITFIVNTGVGGGTNDLVLDVQQHTAYTGGTSNDLDSTAVSTSTGITRWHIKAETALDNDESWVTVTQTEASECTVVAATYGTQQKIVVIEVDADQLGDGYTHVSLTASYAENTAALAGCLYIVHGLRYQRKPSALWNLLNPGTANA
jgi:hypothetical protein